jgi:aromatic-L-amino-acid decarboxylase
VDSAEFRRLGHSLIDWIADYRERMGSLPVMSLALPGEIRARLPKEPPLEGGRLEAALSAFGRDILPGITHWNHPSFFAYFPSVTSYASVLGDLASSGLGSQAMSWQTSPAATEVEEVVLDWLRQMLGLPPDFTGVIQDTASTATLCALICARERSTGFAQSGTGMQSAGPPLVVYASDQAHSSVEKAVRLAGFGLGQLRLVESDADHALRLDRLEQAIERDRRAGLRPCALVATTGTTGTTALDPVAGMAGIAARHGLWLHVDAALAGTAMVLPECRWMWRGIEGADSLVVNPHKWMGAGFDLTAYFLRDPQHLVRVMGTNPSYLRTARDAEVKNFRDWGIPLGRRFRALKLWFYLLDLGVSGLQARLRRDLANAQWLKERVDEAADWERLAPVPLQTLCIRHRPPGESEETRLAAHNLGIVDRLNRSGRAYLNGSILKGTQTVRVSIGAEATERAHVEALWRDLREAAGS